MDIDPEKLALMAAAGSAGKKAIAWLWGIYGKKLTERVGDAAREKWEEFKWDSAAEAYRGKIKKLYGTMQIMGMAAPVPLEDNFTEAYLLDKPTAFSRFNIERLKQSSADPDAPPPSGKRLGGLTLVNRNKNLFILGKPGAGKTTFLKYIAVQSAEPEKPVIDKIPIFISLKRWADSGIELMPFIEERFDICDFPDARPFVEALLKSGSAIVLFDGLDEVNLEGGRRDKQTRSMKDFMDKYDQTQCLITCRIAASVYYFPSFNYVEIADFTEQQIQTFVGNWFRNQEGEKDEETSKRFLKEFKIEENKGLRDLARTPLLLTLLCLAFDATLTFPRRRVEIYEEALDALLKKWDSSRRIKRDEVYRKLSPSHKENMLARIAAETFERNEHFIQQQELERLITDFIKNVPPHDSNKPTDGETILKAVEVQHGIFVERAHKIYSFSHLTFQEYFTAKYIAANAAKGTLTKLVKAHCADKRWREVFLLTTSLLPDASKFMETFRRGVDELLAGKEKLWGLLAWMEEEFGKLNRANRSLARAQVRTDIAHTTRDIALNLDFAIDLTRTLENDTTLDLSEDDYSSLDQCLAVARDLASTLKLYEFARELDVLFLSLDRTIATDWEDFVKRLRALKVKGNFSELECRAFFFNVIDL